MRSWIVVLSLGLVGAGCAVRSSRATTYEPVVETDSGGEWRRTAFENRHGGRIRDPREVDITRVAQSLAAWRQRGPVIEVGVLATFEPNAFVLANGHVYLTAGMLEIICDEDELAGVVAHELAHLDDLSAFGGSGLGGEEKLRIEAEADERAVLLLLDAGFDPAGLRRMIGRLSAEQPIGWSRYRCSRLEDIMGERYPSEESELSADLQ